MDRLDEAKACLKCNAISCELTVNTRAHCRLSGWVLAVLTALCLPARAVSDMVQSDWHFRETLPAIRDWEAILERWENQTPKDERTPVFPVPSNGDAADWPTPVPRLLIPEQDIPLRVQLHLTGGSRVTVRRTPASGARDAELKAGEIFTAYQHPGGGAKDQWYHNYERRFDGLTDVRPQPAPFAIQCEAPFDFQLGKNELRVIFRNVAAEPVSLKVRLRLLDRHGERQVAEQTVAMAPGATNRAGFAFNLESSGGRLLILSMEANHQSWWLPVLAHVEDVDAILTGIGQILADAPDPAAAQALSRLRQRRAEILALAQGEAVLSGNPWRRLFEEASALRDPLLLKRIPFDSILFVKRKPFFSEQPYMDAHHLYNRPGGGIYRLSPVSPAGRVTPVVNSLGEGIYRDAALHWDAGKFLFSFGNGSDQWDGSQSYHIYEIGVDGTGLRQITSGPKNDCEPFYLPAGQIGFTSDRSEHFAMCGGDRHVANLFVIEGGGSMARQISFNVFNEFNPTVLPDGRILYNRWEYNERSVTSLHKLFTIHPDGTHPAPYYGSATIRPNITMFPRAVPGSSKVTALLTAHHGQTHGPIGLIDIEHGIDGAAPLTVLTPNIPVTGEKAEDSQHGWFSDPQPITETTYLCAYTPTVQPWLERSWALYVGDRHGNLALVHRAPEISCAEPVPLVARPMPAPLCAAPAGTDSTNSQAAVLMVDVYRGLPGVARGEVKFLRVLEDVPRKGVKTGGVVVTAATGIYSVKRILGTVPVEADGSAFFVAPANRNVYFEALDERQREIQRMRSVVCFKPGESRTCVGCHEPRQTAPPNMAFLAQHRAPSQPAAPVFGDQTLSFLRDVQPLINAKCASCHTQNRATNRVILTGDLTDQYTVAYEGLLPFVSTANAMRWDHPDDVLPRPPNTYGSKVSRLTRILEKGHYGVALSNDDWSRLGSWMDANCVYYDRFESAWHDRHIFTGATRKTLNEVFGRRCASCHDERKGSPEAVAWQSLNRGDVRHSRALLAPLPRAAGGWERCQGPVFASTADPDYQKLLGALTDLLGRLNKSPREDLLSEKGVVALTDGR